MAFFCIHCRTEIDSKFKACPHCGEAVTDFLRRYLESPIDGKYQILARLGVGGMGEVYKALHIHLNAIRVIKLMRAAIATDPGAHERFLREARLATKIHHPNVAALFDFSTLEDGSRYMVWEHIEGTNLHELIAERGPLSPRYAATLAVQALLGLDAVHRAGIIHRDVSPENLMVTRDDEGKEVVKIIDLGIAKQGGDEGDNKTKTGMFVGKWKYCSPEHLGMLGEGERIDGRADIYSFGIVLYEMLTGVPPFQADTPHKYLMLHASERPKALRTVNPTVTASGELEEVIFKAMEKDRTKRFSTAREFAQALEKLIPSLDDTAGAAALPVATEATEEPTRVAGMRTSDLETVATGGVMVGDSNAATIRTASPLDLLLPVAQEVSDTGETPAPEPVRSRKPLIFAAAVAVIVILALLVPRMLRQTEAGTSPVATTVSATTAPILPQAQARLAINAFPWGNIESIRNLDSGSTVEIAAPMVTPQPVDLAPGRYEVRLSNPGYRGAIVQTIELKAGEDRLLNVEFTEADQAALPQFEVAP